MTYTVRRCFIATAALMTLAGAGIGCQQSPNPTFDGQNGDGFSGTACPTGTNTCVDLRWTASATPNVSYHIWYGTTSGQYTTELDAGTGTSYQVTGLSPGTYYFVATAYNANGESSYSNEATAMLPVMTTNDIRTLAERLIHPEIAVTLHHLR